MKRRNFLQLIPAATLAACNKSDQPTNGKRIIRIGHFPNITHVQALVAHNLSRKGQGWFESRLGVDVEWFTYNAGPSAMEAIFARSLDVTYIGPSPVLNAFAKSKGAEPRILAGAANGGSALLVRPDANISSPKDFRGKKVATPQLGNTQDIQARAWLAEQGFSITQTGGEVHVLPTQNSDQLALFQKGDLDAVWTVEPYASRLEMEAGARVFLEDKETTVTLLAGRTAWIKAQPELAQKLTAAHRELTDWITTHAAEARQLIKAELLELTKAVPKDELLDRALARVVLTNDISRASIDKMVQSAQKVGFLKDITDLKALLP